MTINLLSMELKSNGVYYLTFDQKIREGFIGGSVDVYKVVGNEAYYYDVNSLLFN